MSEAFAGTEAAGGTSGANVSHSSNALASFIAASEATALGVAHHRRDLLVIAAGSVVTFYVTRHYIPRVAEILFRSNLFGIDINKTTAEERQVFAAKRKAGAANDESDVEFKKQVVPESLGILVGAVYLSIVMLLVVLLQPAAAISVLSGPLTTITVMLLLGFVDDVLDVRWRYKMMLSMLGTLPLIMTYDGSTSVLIPPTLRQYIRTLCRWIIFGGSEASMEAAGKGVFGGLLTPVVGGGGAGEGDASVRAAALHLVRSAVHYLQENMYVTAGASGQYLLLFIGPAYLAYLSLLCTFCTNSINILAGVNGVEVGQSLVIAAASVVYNLCQLRLENVLDASVQENSPWLSSDHQIRALLLLGPFIGASLALWQFNRYPAKVFIGDSYTYFAGTVLAVAAVTGVYSKTLLLFFVPQLLNFLLSVPQLFGFVHCPRHRVPRWLREKDVLTNSFNYTLLNAILFVRGDLHERDLTRAVLFFQTLTCGLGFLIRYLIASWMYDSVQ